MQLEGIAKPGHEGVEGPFRHPGEID